MITDDDLREIIASNEALEPGHPLRNERSLEMAMELLVHRSLSMVAMVREFHAKFGVRDADEPDVSDGRTRLLRLRLIDEELDELAGALNCQDVVDTADALADLLYVVIGSALQFGIPIEQVFAEVHRSNMTKDGGGSREDGKILKGPNYSPPDLNFLKEAP